MVCRPSKEKKMATPTIEISEPVVPAETRADSKPHVSQDRSADKRADALKAKKKQKRDAHRVALRRSHTKG